MQRCSVIATLLIALSALLVGCGGSSSEPEARLVGTVEGRVYAPNGALPMAGATVSSPDARGSTVTNAQGDFRLENVPAGNTPITIRKGGWTKIVNKAVTANQVARLTASEGTLPSQVANGAPRIAVVLGQWDKMEDVLAKLGMGQLDDVGHLRRGTESFSIVADGAAFRTLVSSAANLAQYDMIFVNCGADLNPEGLDLEVAKTNVRNWVNQGGVLYVTDLSYPIVEQVFPTDIVFEGMVGQDGITTEGTVHDAALLAWLGAREQLTAGKVHIGGFLSGWAVIRTLGPNTTNLVDGLVTFNAGARPNGSRRGHDHGLGDLRPTTNEVRPLTVTFMHGSGRVLYTSYHTAEEPSLNLRPQEYILGYLALSL
ncbi:MAG: carboxypeptidase regulatory-like domain-containing protein [Fimbriimonadaceae bacterium]|nr:carboxypeptidase regulatory-like domain-containing protein [Fimbriimonadaceae bacterium]